MPTAVYLPEALDDLDAIYTGYEAQLAGLGDRFMRALARAIVLIENNP